MGWIKGLSQKIRALFTDSDGYFPYGNSYVYSPSPEFNQNLQDTEKILKVLNSPAVLKVFALQCDLFSLGKFYVYKGEKEIPDDPFIAMMQKPNPFQGCAQLLWDFMFWNMIGTAYIYVDSAVVSDENKIYLLDHSKMEFPDELDEMKDKLVLSKNTLAKLDKVIVKYRFEDGSSTNLNLKNIISISDLTNGVGNWFKSPSRLEALHKIISNSEAALEAKNINVRYTGKFMVAGKADIDNPTHKIMGEEEKQDIETKMNGSKSVHGVKSMVEVKRFVENMANLKLDDAYLADYYLIGSMYNIPRDVLEAYQSSTYENQEKARASHVSYTLDPKGCTLTEGFSNFFKYTDKRIVIDWSHLPFMQVMEADRVKVLKQKSDIFCSLLDQGVSIDEVNKFLDTDFKTGAKNERQRINIGQN